MNKWEASKKSIVLTLAMKVLIINAFAFFIGLIFVSNWQAYGKGVLLGCVFTILRIKLMENSFKNSMNKLPHKAQNYVRLHYFIRYILTLIVISIGIFEPSIHIVGVVIGLLTMKVAAYWEGYSQEPTPKDGSVEFLEWEDDDEPSDF